MKGKAIKVVYHPGKENLEKLMVKLVMVKVTHEQKLRKHCNGNIPETTIHIKEQG